MRWLARPVILLSSLNLCFGQAGRMDPTFRPAIGGQFSGDGVASVAVQPDGKILVVGAFRNVNGENRDRLVRLIKDGSVDPTFNAGTDGTVSAIQVTPDGKLFLKGVFHSVNGQPRDYIARLNMDGSLDETWQSDWATISGGYSAFQADGKILLIGFEGLYRLHPDGMRDTSFQVRVNRFGYLSAVIVLPNGKIVIGGRFYEVRKVPFTAVRQNNVAMLLPDGTVDPDFDTSALNLGADIFCLLPAGQDKVIVGGDPFARLLPTGQIDTNFYQPSNFSDERDMKYQQDGRMILGGNLKTRDGVNFVTNLMRRFANGDPDLSFNPGHGPHGADNPVRSVAIQADQRILVAGSFTHYDGTPQAYLVRVLNDWPVLDSQKVGPNEMELRWPAVYTNFILQTASSVLSTNWFTVTNSPVIISNMFVLTNSTADGNEFFRLVKP